MEQVPIDPERAPMVQALLAQLRPGEPSAIADLEVPGDPVAVAHAVDPGRLMTTVRELAASPRHPGGAEAGLERALAHIEGELALAGHRVVRTSATVEAATWPSLHITIPGRPDTPAPRPTVVLTGHYDTVPGSPGADDDASGVAAVLEIARLLPPEVLAADVVLAAVPFEERGDFAGARALASALAGRDDVEVVAAISAEMLGFRAETPRIDGDRGSDLILVGYPGADLVVDTVCAASAAFGGGQVRGLAAPTVLPDVQRSDHTAFADLGVPAAMATDGAEYRNPHYHQPTDTPETLDPEFLAGSTRTLAVGLMALATRLGA